MRFFLSVTALESCVWY